MSQRSGSAITDGGSRFGSHESPALSRQRSWRRTALFFTGSIIYLYFLLYTFPLVPHFTGLDGWIYASEAQRMLGGEVLYRDFFEFVTPGTSMTFYTLFWLFGVRAWIYNLLLLAIGLGFAWLGIVISRRVMNPRLVLLPSALFLVIAFAHQLDASHHWFSGLAVMGALAVLIEKRSPARIAVAGALCGIAACFTQSRGPLAALGFGIFLLWEWKRRKGQAGGLRALLKEEACFFGSFLVPVGAVFGYYTWKVGFERLLYSTLIYAVRYYPADAGYNTYRYFIGQLAFIPPWRNLLDSKTWFFIFALIPAIYILLLVRCYRESRKRPEVPWDRLVLLAIVGLFLFLSVASSPGLIRVCAGALPGLVLLGWFVDSPLRLDRALRWMLWGGVLFGVLAGVWRNLDAWKGILDTPAGHVAVLSPETYEKFAWLHQHTRPSDFLFDTSEPEVYFFFHLRNPARVAVVKSSDYTRPEQVAEAIHGLEAHRVRYVLWSIEALDPSRVKSGVPGDNLSPLREYLYANYHVVQTFFDGNETVWERN